MLQIRKVVNGVVTMLKGVAITSRPGTIIDTLRCARQ